MGSQRASRYFSRKRPLMRAVGLLLLTVSSPVMLLLMLAVRMSSRGPALYRQRRLGKNGREFFVLKIRTMHADAERITGPTFCCRDDPRITPLGRYLRNLHLDELPQLLNVVRGEMCLVGPRPERREIVARHHLTEIVPGFSARTRVLPGITGLAQLNLPANDGAESVRDKVALDLEYIATASLGIDCRILLGTLLQCLGCPRETAARVVRLQRPSGFNDEYAMAERNGRGRVHGCPVANCRRTRIAPHTPAKHAAIGVRHKASSRTRVVPTNPFR